MFNKITKAFLLIILSFGFSTMFMAEVNAASAKTKAKVMWGKTELKLGQIGKVTIIEDTPLVKIESDDSISTVRMLKKGEEFRVYQYKGQHNGIYGVGANSFVQTNSLKVLYETPSRKKLGEVKRESTNFYKVYNIYQPVKYGMNSKDLISYLEKSVFYGDSPDEYYFDVNNYNVFNYIRASPYTSDYIYSKPSDNIKFTGDEVIGFNFSPSISYWENRKNQVFTLDFFYGYIGQEYNQTIVYERMLNKISNDIGTPTRKYIRKDKYYEAEWENNEEKAYFSTGIGGNGEAYMSLRLINKQLSEPKFMEYVKKDKTVSID